MTTRREVEESLQRYDVAQTETCNIFMGMYHQVHLLGDGAVRWAPVLCDGKPSKVTYDVTAHASHGTGMWTATIDREGKPLVRDYSPLPDRIAALRDRVFTAVKCWYSGEAPWPTPERLELEGEVRGGDLMLRRQPPPGY